MPTSTASEMRINLNKTFTTRNDYNHKTISIILLSRELATKYLPPKKQIRWKIHKFHLLLLLLLLL